MDFSEHILYQKTDEVREIGSFESVYELEEEEEDINDEIEELNKNVLVDYLLETEDKYICFLYEDDNNNVINDEEKNFSNIFSDNIMDKNNNKNFNNNYANIKNATKYWATRREEKNSMNQGKRIKPGDLVLVRNFSRTKLKPYFVELLRVIKKQYNTVTLADPASGILMNRNVHLKNIVKFNSASSNISPTSGPNGLKFRYVVALEQSFLMSIESTENLNYLASYLNFNFKSTNIRDIAPPKKIEFQAIVNNQII
ncbi:hypothetical protein BCR32DRAFT_284490 [Anaeromyces robustus]|uniref:Uncharacterized protein n=1 Tax=Anaeromyces robustus TaxID=1754192 RepID=A0A1Y1WRG6_9FUNG|nr:hypothetical protein BCR32DRAFT_284490 [Anaeromyces robustus]|eukprot:ORX76129.1 hypothetical protein BCR32DRAFT_284490 [Anaeromyces robustus]